MTRIERIEKAIAELTPAELEDLRQWFEAFEAMRWDEALARDAASGRLDDLAERARADYRAGRAKPL
jgi:hypothetical protein